MKHFLLLLLSAHIAVSAVAQDLTKVRFYVRGSSDFYLRLDGELLPKRNVQLIAPGKHTLEVWSPMFIVHEGEIDVPNKDSVNHYQELSKDPDYIGYLFEMDKYKRKIFLGRTAPLLLGLSGLAASSYLYFARKRWHETYVISQFEFDYYASDKAGLDNNRRRYNAVNASFFTSVGVAVGGAASYFLLRKWVNNLEKPTYKQQNPFTLEFFEVSYQPLYNAPLVGLKLAF